jgi:hypothetical protein
MLGLAGSTQPTEFVNEHARSDVANLGYGRRYISAPGLRRIGYDGPVSGKVWHMSIPLRDIWPIHKLTDHKLHFARWNKHDQPLEVFWKRILLTRGEQGLNRN